MDYYTKYLKYKIKYLNLQKNTKIINKHIGGLIQSDDNYTKIKSIGFEIETANLIPILLNNNIITPYGFNNISGSLTNLPLPPINDIDIDNNNIIVTQDSYHLDEELKLIKNTEYDDLSQGYVITDYLQKHQDINTKNNNTITIDRKSDDSTYGTLEFKITYYSVQPNRNIFYDKMITIYEFLNRFMRKLKLYDEFSITNQYTNDEEKIYYIYTYNNLYFLSDAKKEHLNLIEFTPQITVGIHINDIALIFDLLIEDYYSYNGLGINLKNKLTNIVDNILTKDKFSDYIDYPYIYNFIFMVYFFLNVSSINDYKYDNETDTIHINRDTLSIKIRHKFYDIFNKLLQHKTYENTFFEFIIYIQENKQQQITQYRTNYINNLIANELIANELIKINKKNANILKKMKDSNILWGDLNKDTILNFKTILKTNNINIFTYDNIDNILERIIEADYMFLNGNDGVSDIITSGGTDFEYLNTNDIVLFELRYIHNKNAEYQNIKETIKQLNIINKSNDDRLSQLLRL